MKKLTGYWHIDVGYIFWSTLTYERNTFVNVGLLIKRDDSKEQSLKKLKVAPPAKHFLAFHGLLRFITAFTRTRHCSLRWARTIQSIFRLSASSKSNLAVFSHLLLVLPKELLSPHVFRKHFCRIYDHFNTCYTIRSSYSPRKIILTDKQERRWP
jgi:hypothetical protein